MRTIMNIGLVAIFLSFGVWYAWDQGYLWPRIEITQETWQHADAVVVMNTGNIYAPTKSYLTGDGLDFARRIAGLKPDTIEIDTLIVEESTLDQWYYFETGILHNKGRATPLRIGRFFSRFGRYVEPIGKIDPTKSVI